MFPDKSLLKHHVALCKSCNPIVALQLSSLKILKFSSTFICLIRSNVPSPKSERQSAPPRPASRRRPCTGVCTWFTAFVRTLSKQPVHAHAHRTVPSTMSSRAPLYWPGGLAREPPPAPADRRRSPHLWVATVWQLAAPTGSACVLDFSWVATSSFSCSLWQRNEPSRADGAPYRSAARHSTASWARLPPNPVELATTIHRHHLRLLTPSLNLPEPHLAEHSRSARWSRGSLRPQIHGAAKDYLRLLLRPFQPSKPNPRWARTTPPPFPGQARPSPNRIPVIPVASRGQGLHCEVWGLSRG
jgi:hypothetical protein